MSRRLRSRVGRALACSALTLGVLASCSSGESTVEAAAGDHTSGEPAAAVAPRLTKGPLEPATYRLAFFVNRGMASPDAVITVPAGFNGAPDWYVVSHDGGEFLGLWAVGQVVRDACTRGPTRLFDPGPSVDDLADALVAQKSTRASVPKPVTLAGYDGLYVELASPDDIGRCRQTGLLWGDPGGRCICSPGQVDRVWILDVDGQRLVVDAAYSVNSTAADRDKLSSMIESFAFVPTQ